MKPRARVSARTVSKAVATLLRLYAGLGGPLIAVGLFFGGAGVWWALGSLLPWCGMAWIASRLEGR